MSLASEKLIVSFQRSDFLRHYIADSQIFHFESLQVLESTTMSWQMNRIRAHKMASGFNGSMTP